MFERYTEAARRSIFFARYEAATAGSEYIETEHFLLGLLREDTRVARLLAQSVDLAAVRQEVLGPVGQPTVFAVDLPLSHQMKRVLAYGAEEAEILRHRHIGTEHLLLGLLRESDSRAARVLLKHGFDRDWVLRELPQVGEPGESATGGLHRDAAVPSVEARDGSVTTTRVENGVRIVETRHFYHGHKILIAERFSLSADGKTLTISLDIQGPKKQETHSVAFDVS